MIISGALKNGISVYLTYCISTYREYSRTTYQNYGKSPCLLQQRTIANLGRYDRLLVSGKNLTPSSKTWPSSPKNSRSSPPIGKIKPSMLGQGMGPPPGFSGTVGGKRTGRDHLRA